MGRPFILALKSTIEVARYHSLAAEEVPKTFEVTARSQDGTVMSIRHKLLPIEGVQFHPESVLSMRDEVGMTIIKNVIEGKLSASDTLGYQELMKIFMGNEDVAKKQLEQFIANVKNKKFTDEQMLILLGGTFRQTQRPDLLRRFIEVLQSQSSFQPTANWSVWH